MDNSTIGMHYEKYDQLTLDGKTVYNLLFDYCMYSSDPQYQTLHKFRKKIDQLTNHTDKQLLIEYFNSDPAIRWHGIPTEPWLYYSKPY